MKLPIRIMFGVLILILIGCTVNEVDRRYNSSNIEIIEEEKTKETQPSNISPKEEITKPSNDSKQTSTIEIKKKEIWQPFPRTKWDWQLSVEPKVARGDIKIIDIDLFDNSRENVQELQSLGLKVICYINVGAWEDWREDKNTFSPSIIGKDYDGWEGEKWLDISQTEVLHPIIEKRLDMCQEKGFDAVEPDNTDLHLQDTGFNITYNEQLEYNIWLAEEAHKRGLAIALKNTPEMANQLVEIFDFAILEDCHKDKFCDDFSIFSEYNKAILAAEYVDNYEELDTYMCDEAFDNGISLILKTRTLDNFVELC